MSISFPIIPDGINRRVVEFSEFDNTTNLSHASIRSPCRTRTLLKSNSENSTTSSDRDYVFGFVAFACRA